MLLYDILLIVGVFMSDIVVPLVATAVYLLVFIAAVAVFTKPSRDSFDSFFTSFINDVKQAEAQNVQNYSRSGGYFSSLYESTIIASSFKEFEKACVKQIIDLVVFKVVEIRNAKFTNEKLKFIGAFNGWYPYPR